MLRTLRLSQRLIQPIVSGLSHSSKADLHPRTMSTSTNYEFETLKVTDPSEYVKHVELNRPDKRNAMNTAFWKEIAECFNKLAVDPDCRAVILSGAGKIFTAGLDLRDNDVFQKMMEPSDPSRKAFFLSKTIPALQESFNAIEKCPKPVIAAVHSGCVGGGVDMTSACDIRYCTQDAWFQIKEIDIGLAADLGTLQRFQKIIGNDSLFRELTYTARRFNSDEAKAIGFVSRVFLDRNEMIAAAVEVAKTIASKSPVAVQGSKVNIVYGRDHSVQEGLDYIVAWNAGMLQSEDVMKAVTASMQKQVPEFSKL